MSLVLEKPVNRDLVGPHKSQALHPELNMFLDQSYPHGSNNMWQYAHRRSYDEQRDNNIGRQC